MQCAPGEVHVWRIDLNYAATTVDALRATLSREEERWAARFRSLELFERWKVAYGALRCILAAYARCEPGVLVFRQGPHGKPALTSPAEDIPFNLSHTGGLVRLHIVEKETNRLLWELLGRFGEYEPAPILVKTSPNLPGEPPVVRPRDAVRTFFCSGTDAVFVGNVLLTKSSSAHVLNSRPVQKPEGQGTV